MYQIHIRPDEKKCRVSDSLYGLFFEDINRAGDGGLYAELLRNRAFDDGILPQGCTYDAATKMITSPTGWCSFFDCYEEEGIAAWTAAGDATMKLTADGTLHPNRRRALEVCFRSGRIENDGFMGVPVQEGCSYRFYMFAKSEEPARVTAAIASAKGEAYAAHTFSVHGEYQKYECVLTSPVTDHDARLILFSASEQPVTLGFTSLFPVDTFMGRENGLRKELAERLTALQPAFLRFPGGCIVEGFTEETAFRFKDSIGPVWERKPHWLLWSYMTTNGLGYHEYLQFCEDAGIDAMYVFNCGMTCQGRGPVFMDDALIEELFEDTVQAIEYAIAPADTKWGALRAANGHPEPFRVLKYLEIGNENWGEEYHKRYRLFYERLKKRYPQFIYIANEHTEAAGLPTEIVDEHYYAEPVFFASNTHLYDGLDRQGVKIYCGEYAATVGCKEGTLHGALGEAAFLTGIERNQDVVTMTSYAPLFQNVAYKAWEPDMILFNNHENFVIPSYYMLQMFASHRGSYVCGHDVETEYDRRHELGGFGLVTDSAMTYENVRVNGVPCAVSRQDIAFVGDATKNAQRLTCICTAAGRLHIRFWDSGKKADDQKHFDWIVENGVSRVEHFNGWSRETICTSVPCPLEDENIISIETENDTFCITLNGHEIHRHTLAAIPRMTAVCAVDEHTHEVIIKLVNLSEQPIAVQLNINAPTDDAVRIITLTGDSLQAKNTFENKLNVSPQEGTIVIPQNGTVRIQPRSINVIRKVLEDNP